MSLEEAIEENTIAIRALTEVILGARAKSAEMRTPPEPQPVTVMAPESEPEPEFDQADVDQALLAYIKAKGRDEALKLLQKFGAKTSKAVAESDRAAFIKEASL